MADKSKRFRVLVTGHAVPKEAIDFLEVNNCNVDQWKLESVMPPDEFRSRIKGVDGIYCIFKTPISENLLSEADCGQLKVVATPSTGTNHIDKEALKRRGIRFANTQVHTTAVAEFTVGLIISTTRNFFAAAEAVKKGEWLTEWRPFWLCGRCINELTIGFVGFGSIGQETAKFLKVFCPKMLYHCRMRKPIIEKELGVEWRENLDELLSGCDVVVVCCNLSSSTFHLLSKDRLSTMKRGSYLINISRGDIVDQDGLIELLRQGHFAGVGLDVTSPEPLPACHPLLSFPEVTVIPHIAGASVKAQTDMFMLTSKNIVAALEGREMPNEWKL